MEVSVGQPRDSIYSDFYKASVEIRKDTQQQSTDIFLTRDRHTLVVGMVFPIEARPRPEILNSISLADAATQGPNDAPITILEYADLQCPACARMHEFLENELIPKYEGKVRILFKEFPLVSIHNWAWTGAISNKCVSELAPKRFVAYQSSVFQRQTDITPANVRSSLLQIATTVGIDTSKLSSCIDNQTPKSLIEEDIREGKLLEISTTPTFVVNGRIVAGMPEKSYFYKIIDDALARNMADGGLATHASCACDREFGIRASAPPAGVVRPKQ
jgi:protein-disulfide isomerase